MESQSKQIGICNITPSILEKGQFWFAQNASRISKEAKKPGSWWNVNWFEIEQGQKLPLSNLLRMLDDAGYMRANHVRRPGEFAGRGGIVDLFPINSSHAVRIEYDANIISTIITLPEIKNAKPKEKLHKLIAKEGTRAQNWGKEEVQEHIAQLVAGSYVVHDDHGIALYNGIEHKEEPYLVLQYAKGDTLKVPLTVAHKVTPYIGFARPNVTRLGGNVWEKIKRKVKEDVIKTARQLAELYAKRELATREPYKIDKEISSRVEHSFGYTETPDQLQAIEDIKNDMRGKHPMDRVVCADVGFGKTEVALRAAAFAISAGCQVAIIAPTTVLAHQHYKTFHERFASLSFPVNIKKLTRVETSAQQRQTLEELKNGKCDIVIGTHRILQKDIAFAKLGLLIIDEEQRFGVKQKEYLRNSRTKLDVLSLSATPIPRTLYFALSGIRPISTITTPPAGRRPIKTTVERYSKKTIKDAITFELARGGQIYFLHNKISSLSKTAEYIKKLVRQARVEYMHAQLSEQSLIDTIDKFSEGAIDVLVTTTIMENGLDLKNANTLIVDDATRLGLAQAHQIRGRIGRGRRQAYAYFLHPSRKLPEKAKERLMALKDAQYLGAGYQIALRDLELRGAGNLLGKEQSGNIAKVGFNMYCQMLAEAVEELRSS